MATALRAATVLALGMALAFGAACGGGSPTPSPTSEDNAIWEWIAANSPEVEPVLQVRP